MRTHTNSTQNIISKVCFFSIAALVFLFVDYGFSQCPSNLGERGISKIPVKVLQCSSTFSSSTFSIDEAELLNSLYDDLVLYSSNDKSNFSLPEGTNLKLCSAPTTIFFNDNATSKYSYLPINFKSDKEQYAYVKIELPEEYVIMNKGEIEKISGCNSAKDNEVILKIKIPAVSIEVDHTGTMNAKARPHMLFYLAFGLIWYRRKRFKIFRFIGRKRQKDKTEQELLAEGELKRALQKLLRRKQVALDTDLSNEVTLLLSRLSKVKHSKQLGLIDYEMFNIEFNRVSQAALALIGRI